MTTEAAAVADLNAGWIALAEERHDAPDQLLTVATPLKLPDGLVQQAIDASGIRHLLIPLPQGAPGPTDTSSRVQITVRDVFTDGEMRSFVDVACLAPHLVGVFDDMLAAMLRALQTNATSPAQTCLGVLDHWRELLAPEPSDLPSRDSVVGMIGELLILARIVKEDPARRVDLWRGPHAGRHDMRRGSRAIEVKASLANVGRPLHVNGLDQLLEPPGGTLLLCWVKIEEVPAGLLSVPTLVQRLTTMGVSSLELYRALKRAGMPADVVTRLTGWRFEHRETRVYEVGGDFPRLTHDSFRDGTVPQGIRKITYEIDLSQEPPHPLGAAETDGHFSTIAQAGDAP